MKRATPSLPRVVQPRATKPLRHVLETIAREFDCFALTPNDIDTQTAERIRNVIRLYDEATGAPKPRLARAS